MKYALWLALILLAIGLMIAGCIWLAVYRYHDCKRVGHSTLYCMTDGGK